MNKRYIILAIIAISLGIGMLLMPDKDPNKYSDKKNSPESLLASIDDPSRYLSPDDITDRIIKKDPTLLLIDVRPADQFALFAIPTAINIPIDSLLTEASISMMKQEGKVKVFYSNSGTTSDMAWILAKREGIKEVFVLQDGINTWFKNIVKAEKPAAFEPKEAFDLFNFRIAARQYFYGASTKKVEPEITKAPIKKAVKVQKVEESSGGGC